MGIFQRPFIKPQPKVRNNDKCEIIEEKKGDKLIKKIRGNCSKDQLEALRATSREE